MSDPIKSIRIGTMVQSGKAVEAIRHLLPYGFESFEIGFWKETEDDIKRLAEEIGKLLSDQDVVVGSLGIYGNPLEADNAAHAQLWGHLIDNAHLFGTDIVSGFAGRLRGQSIDASIPRFKEVFQPLADRAQEKDVRLAFENCDCDGSWKSGDWNIAHYPEAWEMMFEAVPNENLGLEWEPCHQLIKLIDPMAQLRKWVQKIFHVHGKDATVMWDVIRESGITGSKPFCFHRTPGFGDSNWTDIISELRRGGFTGSIDIEGWHDPVYNGELEVTGQVHALNYLKQCRGGDFVSNY